MKEKECPGCLKKFKPLRPLQKYCSPFCLYSLKSKKPKTTGLKHKRSQSKDRAEIRKLEKVADSLFQLAGKKLYPKSIISGEPTEVGHHFIPKSQSNNLRYDFNNFIPLTNKEHCRHHLSGDPSIVSTIILKRGYEWYNDLNLRRHIIRKQTKEYLESVIESLSNKLPF